MGTYTVTVTREDGLWAAVVDGLPPNTFAGYDVEHFHDLADTVDAGLRELLGWDGFTLDWHFVSDSHEYTKPLFSALTAAAEADRARAVLAETRQEAVRELHEAGLSYRDIADALQMSHQRVSQLANA